MLLEGGVLRMELPHEPYTVDLVTQDISDLLNRSRRLRIFGVSARMIAPEDLISQKLLMWRVHDRYDILAILMRQRGKLDMNYLKARAEILGVKDLLQKMLKLLEKA